MVKTPVPTDLIGMLLLGRYQILSQLSRGGMGTVYKAQDLKRQVPVAVKVLRPGQQVPGARQRFMAEAKILSRIQHPNIVSVIDFGQLEDERQFLVMEFLDGMTLGQVLKTGRLEPQRACSVALQIVKGIKAVHEQGIVHRDLKPENIFLTGIGGIARAGTAAQSTEVVKVIDFGIAKVTIAGEKGQPPPIEDEATVPPRKARLAALADDSISSEAAKTKPGTALGSPRYMAPEQVRGLGLDGRTDQYAIGCILYHMLTGSVPFDGETPIEVMMAQVGARPLPPRQRLPSLQISDSLEQIVLRMLAKMPEQRFPSLAEVQAALVRELDAIEGRWRQRPKGPQSRSTAENPTLNKRRRTPWLFLAALLFLPPGGYLLTRFLGGRDERLESRLREAQLLGERSLHWAREALGDPSATTREAGVAVLADCPLKEAVPLLASMLEDQDAKVRLTAARALGHRPLPTDRPQALSALRTALRDSDGRVQVVTRLSLLSQGDTTQAAPLRAAITHPDVEVRRLLAEDAGPELDLTPLLSDSSFAVRFAAARTMALLHAGDPRAAPVLLQALHAGGADAVRAFGLLSRLYPQSKPPLPAPDLLAAPADGSSTAAAADLPPDVALPLLRQAVRSSEPALRCLAVKTLGALASQPALDMLHGLLEDQDPMVKAQAAAVLARLDLVVKADADRKSGLFSHKPHLLR